MTMTNDDIESLMTSVPSDDQVKTISKLVERAYALENEITSAEEYLKRLKGELHVLTTSTLVDAMASAGSSEFITDKGLKVSVKDFISGSLPKDESLRARALMWLESVGAQDLIKNHLEADFSRNQDNLVAQVEQLLSELGVGFERKRDVHHSTLKSFANERLKKGEELPIELLGLFVGRKADIKAKK